MYGEIKGLQISLNNTAEQIDAALDQGNRRAFKVWCKRRADLIAKVERILLAMATEPLPTR